MPVITIASTKGGVGKSTVAVNLATQFIHLKTPVALLDADPQGSVSKWNAVREAMIADGAKLTPIFCASAQGDSLLSLALEKSAQGNIVIIDSAGVDNASTRSALLRTDYVLTLSATSALDLWEIDTLLKLITNLERTQKRRIPVLLLFNKVKPTSAKGIQEALDFITDNSIILSHIFKEAVKDRLVYQHTFKEGKGIIEYSPANAEARKEMGVIANELTDFLGINRGSVND